jgi:hypothetical protein
MLACFLVLLKRGGGISFNLRFKGLKILIRPDLLRPPNFAKRKEMNLRNSRALAAGRVIVVFSVSLSAMAQSTSSIQGSAVDSSSGKAVTGAIVIASGVSLPATRRVATSAYDASFQITLLPAGTYNMCMQFPADGYLSTCDWGNAAATVTLSAGQKFTATKVSLKAASILKIHLDDPGQLLNQKTKQGYAQHLVLGVWNGSHFYHAHVAGTTAVTADYQVAVPFDTALRLTVQSVTLALGNASKVPLAGNSDQQSFQHASTDTAPVSFSYTILSALP